MLSVSLRFLFFYFLSIGGHPGWRHEKELGGIGRIGRTAGPYDTGEGPWCRIVLEKKELCDMGVCYYNPLRIHDDARPGDIEGPG